MRRSISSEGARRRRSQRQRHGPDGAKSDPHSRPRTAKKGSAGLSTPAARQTRIAGVIRDTYATPTRRIHVAGGGGRERGEREGGRKGKRRRERRGKGERGPKHEPFFMHFHLKKHTQLQEPTPAHVKSGSAFDQAIHQDPRGLSAKYSRRDREMKLPLRGRPQTLRTTLPIATEGSMLHTNLPILDSCLRAPCCCNFPLRSDKYRRA